MKSSAWAAHAWLCWRICRVGPAHSPGRAALAGLAPWPTDSARSKACDTSARSERGAPRPLHAGAHRQPSNPVLKEFYQRLIAATNGQSVLTAVMRKLLIHMNSELKNSPPTLNETAGKSKKQKNPCK